MVVDCNGQDLFGEILTDHVLIEDLPDLVRRGKFVLIRARRVGGGALLPDDVVAELDALVTNEHRGTGDKLADLVLALAAKGAVKKLVAGRLVCHEPPRIPPTAPPGCQPRAKRPGGSTTLYRA